MSRLLFLGSTVSPEPKIQTFDDNRLFPYGLTSIPTNHIYHNLTRVGTCFNENF